MADISITKYKTKVTKPTASPSNPGYPTSDPIDPVNPPASGAGGGGVNTFLQLTDTPATYTGQAGLFPKVNSGETALEFFNPLSLPLTGYTVGSNTALADTDTILGAFGKVQGQINARISGTIASGQVAFGTGVNTVGGDAGMTWDNSLKRFAVLSTGNQAAFFASTTATIASGQGTLNLRSTETAAADLGGVISFRANTTTLSNYTVAVIAGKHETLASGNFSGYLQFITTTAAGNTTEKARITSTGLFGVLTNAPTNTLDVNGTARIRSVANGTGNFATYSATGVLQQRTAAEVASDIGAVTGSGVSGRVTYWNGSNTVNSDSDFLWNDSLNRLTIGSSSNAVIGTPNIFLGRDNNSETSIQISNSTSGTSGSVTVRLSGAGTRNTTFGEYSSLHSLTELQNKFVIDVNNVNTHSFAIFINNSTSVFEIYGGGRSSTDKNLTLFSNGNLLLQRGGTHTDNGFKLDVNGTVRVQGNQTLTDGSNFIFGTTTGTIVATSPTQKLGVWGATPIVQPTTAVTGATLVGGGGTTITDTDTFDGYTLAQIVKALRNIGLLA